jgi:hypothetical protein
LNGIGARFNKASVDGYHQARDSVWADADYVIRC